MTTPGVVLAAGDATRFPNKTLMPFFDSETKIVLQSAIHLLRRFGCDPIVVVGPPGDLLKMVLRRFDENVEYVVQPMALGVVDAIQRAAATVKNEFYVAFGDNAYSHEEKDVYEGSCNYAVVRRYVTDKTNKQSCGPESMWTQLDGYNSHKSLWMQRPHSLPLYLAGWMKLYRSLVEDLDPNLSLIDALNKMSTIAYQINETARWMDLGTPEAYEEFVKYECYRYFQTPATKELT